MRSRHCEYYTLFILICLEATASDILIDDNDGLLTDAPERHILAGSSLRKKPYQAHVRRAAGVRDDRDGWRGVPDRSGSLCNLERQTCNVVRLCQPWPAQELSPGHQTHASVSPRGGGAADAPAWAGRTGGRRSDRQRGYASLDSLCLVCLPPAIAQISGMISVLIRTARWQGKSPS